MIAIGSDNLLTLTGLFDTVTSAYVNDAVVSCVLAAPSGTNLYSASLSYIGSSSGNYRGSLPAATAATLTNGVVYYLTFTATSAGIVFVDQQAHVAAYTAT